MPFTKIWKTNPSPTQRPEQDEKVGEYIGMSSELYDSDPTHKGLVKEEIEFFASHIQDTPTLEIGSGTGRVSIPLLEKGCDLFGIEGSAPMLQRLHQKLDSDQHHRFICWDAQQIPYPVDAQTFACIIIPFGTFALAHNKVQDSGANQMMHEFYRILQPQGLLFIDDFRITTLNKNEVEQYSKVWEIMHDHPKYGKVKEERIYRYTVEKNRLFEQQMIQQRTNRYTRVADQTVLEEYELQYPVCDPSDFPILGADAGFEYLQGQRVEFYEKPTMIHQFRKLV